jgi:curli biogenesis system outer membrane secretion channel CsgG
MACIGRFTALGLAGTLLLTPGLKAQQRPAPTVAVVGFLAESASRVSTKAADAMADGLALQLVESGRYRVLDRTWLGVDSGTTQRTPLERLRDTAKDAGVDYLVVGRVSKYSETRRYASAGPTMVAPFGRPFSGYAPMRPRTTTKRFDYLRLSIDLVDVTTGSVLTKVSSTCTMPQKSGLARTAPLLLLPASPIAAAAALLAGTKTASSGLDPGLERAMTTAGQALISWHRPASVSR